MIEVRSEHFIVNTNSNEKAGAEDRRAIRTHAVEFHAGVPQQLPIDPPSPVIVLAIRDEKDFRALEPAEYLKKGQLQLGGLFLRAPDKNYMLMRIDAEGDHLRGDVSRVLRTCCWPRMRSGCPSG